MKTGRFCRDRSCIIRPDPRTDPRIRAFAYGNPQRGPGRMDVLQPQGTWKADQAALLKVWTARLTRSVRGDSVCSVHLIEASAICFVPAIAVSIAVFVK